MLALTLLARPGVAVSYRIEWNDGHTTSYTPAAGALHAAPKRAGAAN